MRDAGRRYRLAALQGRGIYIRRHGKVDKIEMISGESDDVITATRR